MAIILRTIEAEFNVRGEHEPTVFPWGRPIRCGHADTGKEGYREATDPFASQSARKKIKYKNSSFC